MNLSILKGAKARLCAASAVVLTAPMAFADGGASNLVSLAQTKVAEATSSVESMGVSFIQFTLAGVVIFVFVRMLRRL